MANSNNVVAYAKAAIALHNIQNVWSIAQLALLMERKGTLGLQTVGMTSSNRYV